MYFLFCNIFILIMGNYSKIFIYFQKCSQIMSTLTHPIHLQPHHSIGNDPIDTKSLISHHRHGYTRLFEDSSAVSFIIIIIK